MRSPESGAPDTIVSLLASDERVAATIDQEGRLVALALGEERFEFSEYSELNAKVKYYGPANAQSETLLDLSQCDASSAIDALDEASPADALNSLLEWYSADERACLAEALATLSVADIGGALSALSLHAETLLGTELQLDQVVQNRIVCGGESQSDCAAIVAARAPELIDVLAHLDPNAQTVAGFTIDSGALRPIRSEWDALIVHEVIDADFSWREVFCDDSVFAEMDIRCAQYVPPDDSVPNLHGPTFVVDGISYSSSPVAIETVTGFAYPLAGVGISDGYASGARVWYGSGSCLSFHSVGTGVQDMKGGTSTTIDSFPWTRLEFTPGSMGVAIPQMRGFTYPIRYMLDPEYDRTSELREFQWGVRLESDGSVYVDSNGYHEYLLRFADGTTSRAAWDPSTNAPADTFFAGESSNLLRRFSNSLPSSGHFCRFREQTSIQLEPRCVETTASNVGNAKRKLCYSGGMLNGEYTLTRTDGSTIETGKFLNNRPAEGWTFWDDQKEVAFSGSFNEHGLQSGDWEYHGFGSQRRQIPFSSVTKPSPNGALYRFLDGRYIEQEASTVRLEGRLLEGFEHEWWYSYDSSGAIQEATQYDATRLITTGQQCLVGGGECVDIKQSLRTKTQTFRWKACGVAYPYRIDRVWNTNGTMASQSCVKLQGTPQEYSVVEQLSSCPYTCS